MAPVVSWIIVALVAAAATMLVASVAGGRSGGLRQFLADLRAGLRRDRSRPRGGMLGDVRRDLAEAADVERSSVDELFTFGPQEGSAYVHPQELSQTLGRATIRAVRGVTSLSRR